MRVSKQKFFWMVDLTTFRTQKNRWTSSMSLGSCWPCVWNSAVWSGSVFPNICKPSVPYPHRTGIFVHYCCILFLHGLLCVYVSSILDHFPQTFFLCFCFMHMLHQCSKCIANCLPFKVSLLYHLNFQTSTRSCTVDYVSHSSPSRICSRFSPWKQLTGRMSEEIFGRGKLEFFKWAKKTPQRILVLWKVTLLYMLYIYIIMYNYLIVYMYFFGGARYSMLLISELYLGDTLFGRSLKTTEPI